MKPILIKTMMLGAIILMLSGCASSKLELELAIYKEDPFLIEIVSAGDIDQVINNLQDLSTKIDPIAKSRTDLAADILSIYAQFQFIKSKALAEKNGETYTKQDLENDLRASRSRKYLREFGLYIDETRALCKGNLKAAIRWLEKYKRLLTTGSGDAAASNLEMTARKYKTLQITRLAIADVQKAFNMLAGPTGTRFENNLQSMWPRVFARMGSQQVQDWIADTKNSAYLDELKTRAGSVTAKLKEIEDQGVEINQELFKELEFVNQLTQPENMKRIEKAFMKPATMKVSLGDKAFLEKLKKFDLLGSQIERLQDPSDPVWKIVTDPENDKKWNVEFSRSYFRAEGNSSVVVVRDSPMEFRVQQGSNDPTALVQAQLQVSRAIADAAITVAGATTGVNLVPLTKSKTDKPAESNDTLANESEELARLKAKVAREAELRELSISTMRTNLRTLRSQIEPLDPTGDKVMLERLLKALVAKLKADEMIFRPETDDDR